MNDPLQPPAEIMRSEVLDWWETERLRISQDLTERLPLLLFQIKEAVAGMGAQELLARRKFRRTTIDPMVQKWIESEYLRQSSGLKASYCEAFKDTGENDKWSLGEISTAGAALVFSVAPLAALPFISGGFVAAGTTVLGVTFGGGALLVLPIVAAGAGLVALGSGQSARGAAMDRIKAQIAKRLEEQVTLRVLGDAVRPDVGSLRGTLFKDIDTILGQRLVKLETQKQ